MKTQSCYRNCCLQIASTLCAPMSNEFNSAGVFATEKSNLHITLKCSSAAERKTAGTCACQTHYFYRCFYFSSSLKCTSESSPSGHRLINKLPCVPFCALLCRLVFQRYKVTVVQGLPGGGCRHASLLHFRPKLLTGRPKKRKKDKSSSISCVPAHPICEARC